MSDEIEVVFLGVNDAGMRVYDWLCNRDDIFVHSLLTTKEQLRSIEDIQPDYLVSCGYRHVVPREILDIPNGGCLNLHPSFLPFNRGANPNVWSIVEGTPAGVTLHFMDEGVDTGAIIAQQRVEKRFSDTGRSLQERLNEAQVELFKRAWPDVVSDDFVAEAQDEDAGTYHRTAEFEELCKLDTDEETTVAALLNRLRALTYPPYDNARIEMNGEVYHVEVDIEKE